MARRRQQCVGEQFVYDDAGCECFRAQTHSLLQVGLPARCRTQGPQSENAPLQFPRDIVSFCTDRCLVWTERYQTTTKHYSALFDAWRRHLTLEVNGTTYSKLGPLLFLLLLLSLSLLLLLTFCILPLVGGARHMPSYFEVDGIVDPWHRIMLLLLLLLVAAAAADSLMR